MRTRIDLVDSSFKNLPRALFINTNRNRTKPSVLWVPPLKEHPITEEIDWLSSLQISKVQFSKGKTWSDELRKTITDLELPLDETPTFKNSKTIVFSLPEGFVSSIGVIVLNSDWSSREDVYEKYMEACENFTSKFTIQSLSPWSSEETSGIQWIKI